MQSARSAAKVAQMMGVPVIAIAGYIDDQLDLNELRQCGIEACFSVVNGLAIYRPR